MKNVDLQVRCVICNQIKTVTVLKEDAIEYLNPQREMPIQNIFPYLSPEQGSYLSPISVQSVGMTSSHQKKNLKVRNMMSNH